VSLRGLVNSGCVSAGKQVRVTEIGGPNPPGRLRRALDCQWPHKEKAAIHREGTHGRTRQKGSIKDKGAWSIICTQGKGTINGLPLNSPKLARFVELAEDEYFCTGAGAKAGVIFENTSTTEPMVARRYFGPEANPDAPAMGAYKK